MKLWMDVMRDLESVMNDHERILDAWAEGGVDGVVFGPLVFGTSKLSKDAKSAPTGDVVAEAYDPNPAVYERLGVEPPKAPEHKLPEKRTLLEKTMIAAKDRGMQVYCMYADGGGGPGGDGHHLHDERTLASRLARMVDTLEHFPMADGAVMDGPEWGYEMAPHHMNHRSYFFNDLPDSVAPMAKDLGYDYQAMVGARDRLLDLFHNLDPVRIRAHARGGLVGAHHLDFSLVAAKEGIVFDGEGPPNRIILSAPSQNVVTAHITGRAAHAGLEPEKGISALLIAAEILGRLPLGRIDEETTANIGRMEGGLKRNIIPEQAFLDGEFRSRSDEKLADVERKFRGVFEEVASRFPKAKIDLDIVNTYQAYNVDPNADAVAIIGEALAHIGLEPILETTGGGSDANVFIGKGISAIPVGIGVRDFHTTWETAVIAEVLQGAQMCQRIIKGS